MMFLHSNTQPFCYRAEYFTGWNDEYDREKSFLCEVWVKDYARWANINKVRVIVYLWKARLMYAVRYGSPSVPVAISRK